MSTHSQENITLKVGKTEVCRLTQEGCNIAGYHSNEFTGVIKYARVSRSRIKVYATVGHLRHCKRAESAIIVLAGKNLEGEGRGLL